ncbi:cfap36 [Symbiodinium microadriaticum]|nr:cfap36 [Symbiodinium microadriaticum]
MQFLMPDLQSLRFEALAVAKKIGAAAHATRKEVQRLKMDRAELLAKLSSQQQALDKVNFEIRQHSEHVEELKERSQNLEEMMANMDQADALQVQKATQESQRIQSFFASMNKEIQKAREKKANLDARIAQLTVERQKEEQRAKNQAQEARAVATEVEQANSELADVKQEISKLDGQIQAQQSKEEKMKNELQQEQVRYQQELKDKAIREQQIEGLTTELAAKSKAASALEAQYIKLQRKARAAKRLLEKEKAKAKEQEKEAQDQLQREKAKAEAQAHEDAAELQRVQEMLQKEAKLAKESFAEEVKRVENKHLKEVKEQEQKIAHQVEIEKGQIMEKVSQLHRELAHEQKVGQDQAAEATKKEEALRAELRKTKEAAEEKAQSTKKRMADMQSSLDSQRKASAEKVQAANLNLQKVQEEVVEEEQALASKKAELRRIEKEAKSMEERADLAERQAQQKEAHLQAKIRAANLMERRGKTALQRQAEHQAAKLKKMIADEKSMEREQVEERRKHFWRTLPPSSFLAVNRREWEERRLPHPLRAPPAAERRTAGAEGARIPGDGTSWGLALHTTEITSAPPRKEQQLPYFFEEIPESPQIPLMARGVPAISGQNCRFNGLKLQTGRLLAGLLDSRVQACFMKTRCAENTIRVILHADFDFLLIHFVNYNHSLLPPTPRGLAIQEQANLSRAVYRSKSMPSSFERSRARATGSESLQTLSPDCAMADNQDLEWWQWLQKGRLSDYVLSFLKSPSWVAPIAQFVDEQCIIFEDEEENKLEYTECHNEFRQLIDNLLAAHLLELDVSNEQFEQFCQTGLSTNSTLHRVLVEQLLAVDDFLIFKAMMTKRNADLYREAQRRVDAGQLDEEDFHETTVVDDDEEVLAGLGEMTVEASLVADEWKMYEDQLFQALDESQKADDELARQRQKEEVLDCRFREFAA